jgi:hypothetical protein
MSSATPPAMPDLKNANPYDLGQIALGGLVFIFSLFSWYYHESVSFAGYSYSASANGWHGFWAIVGILTALAAAVLVGLVLFGIELPFPARMITLYVWGVSLVCTFLNLFLSPGGAGHGVGYWLILLMTIGGAALAFLRKDAPAAALPSSGMSTPPAPPA